MAIAVKICGLNDPGAVAAAVEGGATMLGFVFYPPSPRAVLPEAAARLTAGVPRDVARVALLVNPDDETLDRVLAAFPADIVQLHGSETPRRVGEVKALVCRPVMKAIRVATAADVDAARDYADAADRLLFDARPPKQPGALPGGNGAAFDWRLLEGRRWPVPWVLSGGLDAGNVAEAVRVTGARAIDVSSGVEERPGRKSPARIAAFLKAAAAL